MVADISCKTQGQQTTDWGATLIANSVGMVDKLRLVFPIFNGWQLSRVFYYMWTIYESQMSVFRNKIS